LKHWPSCQSEGHGKLGAPEEQLSSLISGHLWCGRAHNDISWIDKLLLVVSTGWCQKYKQRASKA